MLAMAMKPKKMQIKVCHGDRGYGCLDSMVFSECRRVTCITSLCFIKSHYEHIMPMKVQGTMVLESGHVCTAESKMARYALLFWALRSGEA